MGDERNFRSQFYGKVGLREGEEKREVEALLKEQPLDHNKLASFSQRSIVPAAYRTLVWKLLLGITPHYAESHEYVRQQQTLMYNELWCAIRSLGLANISSLTDDVVNGHDSRKDKHNKLSDIPFPEHYLLMWLMSEARLMFDVRQQLREKRNQHLVAIARKVSFFYDNPVEAFHVCASLWSLLLKNEKAINDAVHESVVLLKKENDILHMHLFKLGLFSSSLLKYQCLSLFCDIFPESASEKIIEKIIAGAFRFLGFVIVALLSHLRRSLGSASTVEGVRSVLYNVRKEEAESVVTTALDHWFKVGLAKRG